MAKNTVKRCSCNIFYKKVAKSFGGFKIIRTFATANETIEFWCVSSAG